MSIETFDYSNERNRRAAVGLIEEVQKIGASTANQVWLDATRFGAFTGVLPAGVQRWTALGFADNNSNANAVFTMPSHWKTFAVDLYWSNNAATTGNVVFRIDYISRNPGEILSLPFNDAAGVGTPDVRAVPGQYTLFKSTIITSKNVASGKDISIITVTRLGADAADTFVGDIPVIGVMLRKVT